MESAGDKQLIVYTATGCTCASTALARRVIPVGNSVANRAGWLAPSLTLTQFSFSAPDGSLTHSTYSAA